MYLWSAYSIMYNVKPDHKNKKPRHVAENLGTNFFHIKLLTPNVKMDQLMFFILMVIFKETIDTLCKIRVHIHRLI
jgi:hypothetical protein